MQMKTTKPEIKETKRKDLLKRSQGVHLLIYLDSILGDILLLRSQSF